MSSESLQAPERGALVSRPASAGGAPSTSSPGRVQLKQVVAGAGSFDEQVQMLSPLERSAPRRTPSTPAQGDVQMRAVRRTSAEMNGVVGGKVTLDDYANEAGVTDEDVASAGAGVEATNKKSLAEVVAEMKASVGSAHPLARTEKEMLAAIKSGALPRYVARVHLAEKFKNDKTFGYSGGHQVFATEPADLLGLTPAQALVKVGWEPGQLLEHVGKEIAVCIFDTQTPVSTGAGGDGATKNTVTEMNWDTLEAAVADKAGNGWFYKQLGKFTKDVEGTEVTVDEADLPRLFQLARTVPVGGMPKADAVWRAKYEIFRDALSAGVAANKLYSGMGATVSGKGETGAREVMVMNDGTGFKLEPGVNCEIIDIGKLDQGELDGLM